ncbi:MAG: hypothetical protein ACLFT3_10865 [Cyclobacteriaceae bacterium]
MKLYQKRDFGEKINATFTFLRDNIVPLGKSLLYIAGPAILLVGIVSAISFSGILFNNGEMTEEGLLANLGGSGFANLLAILSIPLVIGVVYAYLNLYFEREDEPEISVNEVWTQVKKYYLPFLLSVIVTSLLTIIGFVFLIIPGFLLMAALSFIFILQVQEKLSFGEAFSRCFKLVSDHYLSTLGLLLVMLILQSIITSVFNLPLMIFMGAGGFLSASGDFDMENSSAVVQALFIILQVISTLGSQFLYAITLVAIAFQYGNLVEKKESAGLMQEVEMIGKDKKYNSEEEMY